MGSILGIIGLLTVPIGATQIAVTQAVLAKESRGQTFSLLSLSSRSLGAGLVATLALIVSTPAVDAYLRIKSPIPMYLVAIWIPLATVSAILQGALIGEYRFRPVAFATFVGSGIIRLALGAVIVESGFGVSGAVSATIFAQIFTLVSLVFSARHELFTHHHAATIRTKLRDTTLSVAALTGYTTFISIDTFLARHFFTSALAGKYAAAAVVSHIAFFVPTAIVAVAFPHLVEGKGVSENSRRIFRQTLQISLILGIAAAGFMALFPITVIDVLFGSPYSSASDIVGMLSLASVAIGIMILFVYLHLARRSLAALTPWVGVVLSIVLIYVFHGSMQSIAFAMLVVSLVTMLFAIVPVFFRVSASRTDRGTADPTIFQ
jgi:O-antigen/teichoic acid export membrane protein